MFRNRAVWIKRPALTKKAAAGGLAEAERLAPELPIRGPVIIPPFSAFGSELGVCTRFGTILQLRPIRAQDMPKKPPVTHRPILGRRAATQPAPLVRSLDELRHEAASCKACPLWEPATQTVFGEGARHATIVFIGEQPGDTEDIAGRPFVGPAGQLLDRALAEAGIDRRQVYVTNAVKHFKFEPRGKRRLHKKPADAEIDACYRWLERELEMIKPKVIVALGASAARAVLGRATPIGSNRGRLVPLSASTQLIITVHPSFLLRIRGEAKDAEYRRFVADLKLASPFLGINKH